MYGTNTNCNHKGFKDYKNYEAQLFTYTILSSRIYFSYTDVTLAQPAHFLNGCYSLQSKQPQTQQQFSASKDT